MSKYIKTITTVMFFALIISFSTIANAESTDVEITKANFYAAWGMSTLQNVEIANNTSSTLKNIEIEIKYKNSYNNDDQIAMITLPVEVPANSKSIYLKDGLKQIIVNSGGIAAMHIGKTKINVINSGNLKVVSLEIKKADFNS